MKKRFTAYYIAIIDIHTKQALSITGPFETVTDAQHDSIWLTYDYQKTIAKIIPIQF